MSTENPVVAAHAVTPDALALDQLALIGVMHRGNTPSALLRTADGRIHKIAIGDPVNGQTTAAIADDAVTIVCPSGNQTVLKMPS